MVGDPQDDDMLDSLNVSFPKHFYCVQHKMHTICSIEHTTFGTHYATQKLKLHQLEL